MLHEKVQFLRRLLRYRMVSGEIIPPDARVDPDEFPEKEFPLYCPECDYLLRGLPEARCPECGHPFDRGRLLVEQYVIEQGKRLWMRMGKYAKALLVIGCLLIFVPKILIALGVALVDPAKLSKPTMDLVFKLIPLVMATMAVGGILLFVSCFLYLHLATVGRKKHIQVLGGIDRDNPSFKKAQQRKWVWWVVWLGLMTSLLIVAAIRSGGAWCRYYTQSPIRMLIPLAVAISVGIWISIGIWLLKRWQDRRDQPNDMDRT